MSNITLQLQAIDFKGTNYCSNGACAIEKAMLRQENVTAHEGVDSTWYEVGDKDGLVSFTHKVYDSGMFDKDKKTAEELHYDNTVIRTIELIYDEP